MSTTKAKPAVKTGTGFQRMKAKLGATKTEELRQQVLGDQSKARAETPQTKTETAAVKVAAVKTSKPKTAKADPRKITLLAKSNPHASGSRRAGWFKLLKTGMTVDEAVALGVRSIYVKRMADKQIIKLG